MNPREEVGIEMDEDEVTEPNETVGVEAPSEGAPAGEGDGTIIVPPRM